MYLIASSSSRIFLAQGIIGENMLNIKMNGISFTVTGSADMKSECNLPYLTLGLSAIIFSLINGSVSEFLEVPYILVLSHFFKKKMNHEKLIC